METTTIKNETQSIEKENVELVKKFYNLLDEQKLDDLDALFTSNHKIYYQSSKEPATLEDMKPYINMFYNAFPDYTHNLGHSIAVENMVSIYMTYTATHSNKFMEIEPTQNKIDYAGVGNFKIIDGKIDKAWIVEDELTMMKQLGLEMK